MKFKLLAGLVFACATLCASAMAQTPNSALPAASSANPGDLLSCSQATGVAGHWLSRGCTPAQIVPAGGGEILSHKGAPSGYAGLDSAAHLPTTNLPALSGGDAYTSAGSGAITLNAVASSPGAYPKVTFNAKGLVTGGGPLAGSDITAAGGVLSSALGTASSHAATDFDVAGAASAAQTAAQAYSGNASNLISGTVGHARLPALVASDITTPGGLLRAQASCRLVDAYGADPSGTVASDGAVTAALAASPLANQTCIQFGPGTYKFASPISYTLSGVGSSLAVLGVGDASRLVWAAGNGISVSYGDTSQSATIEKLALLTSDAATSGNGDCILLTYAGSSSTEAYSGMTSIRNVTCRGADKFAGADFWNTCLYDNGISNVDVDGVNFTGASSNAGAYGNESTLIYLQGQSSADYAVAININASFLDYAAIGLQYGPYVQGVTATATNFTGDTTDVYAAASAAGADQLALMNCQLSFSSFGVNLLAAVPGFFAIGNVISASVAGGTGINLSPAHLFVIQGNLFGGGAATTTGVIATNTVSGTGGTITGNVFYVLTTGVSLSSSATKVNVQSNTYVGNTTNVSNAGTGNTVGGGSP